MRFASLTVAVLAGIAGNAAGQIAMVAGETNGGAGAVATTAGPPAWMRYCTVDTAPPSKTIGLALNRVECTGTEFSPMRVLPFLPAEARFLMGYFHGFDSPVKRVPITAFKSASQLRYVYLNDNVIKKIDDDSFIDNTELEFLSLRNNALREIQVGLFAGLVKLWYLDLSGNSLTGLRVAPFLGMRSVRYMNMADNALEEIECGFFSNFVPALNFVNFSRAKIECKLVTTTDPNEETDGTPVAEIQCDCGFGYFRKSFCHSQQCPTGVRSVVNTKIKHVTLDVSGAGWTWLAESLMLWKRNWQDTLHRERVKSGKSGASATVGGSGMSVPMMLVCIAGVVGIMAGLVVATRHREHDGHTLSSSASSSAVSTAISNNTGSSKPSCVADSTFDTGSMSNEQWGETGTAGPVAPGYIHIESPADAGSKLAQSISIQSASSSHSALSSVSTGTSASTTSGSRIAYL